MSISFVGIQFSSAGGYYEDPSIDKDHGAPSGQKKAPEFALTMIPPSPVTDKVDLDIRAAVRNDGETRESYRVAIYLNDTDETNLLHREQLEVEASSAKGIEFRWPVHGQAGQHKIVMVVRDSSGRETRIARPLEVLQTGERSTMRIDGAWAGLYHWSEAEGRPWNKDIKKMTNADWRELVRGMHDLGMDIIVIQELFRNEKYVGKHDIESQGYQGQAFYPSKIYPDRMPIAAQDPLEAILSEADKLGMYVFPGVGLYAWFDFSPASLDWHIRVANELWEMYGHHPSFYGWYVSEEIAGNLGTNTKRREDIVKFFKSFSSHVKSLAPEKPVMMAPNSHHIRESDGYYQKLLPHLDILCPFGFHRMPDGDLTGEEAAELLQQYCDEAGSHLWMDMEAFDFGPGSALVPRQIEGLLSDMRRFPNFEKILCYQYPGLFTAPDASVRLGGDEAVRQYRDYKSYLDGELELFVKHAARGKDVDYRTEHSPRYRGGANALVDGLQGRKDSLGLWRGYHGVDLDAVIDMGEVVGVNDISTTFLYYPEAGIYPPEWVEYAASLSGDDFELVAEGRPKLDQAEGRQLVDFTCMPENMKTRYIRVRARNIGKLPEDHQAAGEPAWLFVDEIVVNGEE